MTWAGIMRGLRWTRQGARAAIVLKSGRSTMLAGKRLAKVEENISHLISAETVRHGGHIRDPKRESSEMIVV